MVLHIDLKSLIIEKGKSNENYHEVGIDHNGNFWFFYFNLFNDAIFYCSLPESKDLKIMKDRFSISCF